MEISIGQRVSRWRLHRGLTMTALAEASGMNITKLHRIEHGSQDPKHSDVKALAVVFGVTVAEFYACTPAPPLAAEVASG
jgi:transcriptional regulator with XRE-family HTH domain